MDEETTQDHHYPHQEFQNLTISQGILNLPPEVKARLSEEYDKFYSYLHQEDFQGLMSVTKLFKEWLLWKTVSRELIIELGMIPHLLSLLSNKYAHEKDLQVQIAWLLANIATGNIEEIQTLVEMGIIPVMAHALKEIFNDELHENIMWTFANIATEDHLIYRDLILQEGVLDFLAKELLTVQKRGLYSRTAVWLLSLLLRGRPFPSFEKVEKIFATLAQMIECPDEIVVEYIMKCLVHLSAGAQDPHLKCFSDQNLIQKTMKFTNNPNREIAKNAHEVIENLAKANQTLVQEDLEM